MSIDFDRMRREVDTLLAGYGIPPETLTKRYVLERIDEAVKWLGRRDPSRARRFRNEAVALLEDMELKAAAESHLFPGVDRRLRRLKGEGVHLAIATRNCQKALEKIMGGAERYFEVILTRENSMGYKPEPAALLPILERFSLKGDHVFMIGDHPLDVIAARRASIVPIAVLTGTGKREDLARAGAAKIFWHVNRAIDFLFPATSS